MTTFLRLSHHVSLPLPIGRGSFRRRVRARGGRQDTSPKRRHSPESAVLQCVWLLFFGVKSAQSEMCTLIAYSLNFDPRVTETRY